MDIKDYKIEINLPDNSVTNTLELWTKLINEKQDVKDEWVELESLPGYRFKNLRFLPTDSTDSNEISMTITYDQYEKI